MTDLIPACCRLHRPLGLREIGSLQFSPNLGPESGKTASKPLICIGVGTEVSERPSFLRAADVQLSPSIVSYRLELFTTQADRANSFMRSATGRSHQDRASNDSSETPNRGTGQTWTVKRESYERHMVTEDNPYRPPRFGGPVGAAPWAGPLLSVGTVLLMVALVAGLAAVAPEWRWICCGVMISAAVVGVLVVRVSFRLHRRKHVY